MNQTLRGLCEVFWVCLGASVLYAGLAFFLIRHRALWSRLLDAEERFWMRLGLPKRLATFGRGLGEGRFFRISIAVAAVALLLLALASGVLYLHYRQRLQHR